MKLKILALVGLFACSTLACQEVEQPTTTLTQEQWKEVKTNILTEEPAPKYKIGANFEDKIELIGFDVSEPIVAGKQATFTWYWRAKADIKQNWKVFIHFDSNEKPYRQNLDHVPVDNLYQTSRWKKDQIIKDVQKVTIRADFPGGKAVPYLGFYRGQTRLKLINDVSQTKEDQPRVIGPTLTVKGGAAKAKPSPKPKYALRIMKEEAAKDVVIDGKVDDAAWGNVPLLDLKPFGNAPKLATWAKFFVTDDHLYMAAFATDQHAWGTLTDRDSDTWTEEVVELFLDVNGDGKDYLELQITPAGVIFDAHFVERLGRGKGSRQQQIDKARAFNLEGIEVKVAVDGTLNDDSDKDRSWTIEARIPLAQIPGLSAKPAKAGDTWAVNVYRFDRPKEKVTHAYAWSTAPRGDFHQVDKFGEFKLSADAPLKTPVISPELVKEIRKNVDIKVGSPTQLSPKKIQESTPAAAESPGPASQN